MHQRQTARKPPESAADKIHDYYLLREHSRHTLSELDVPQKRSQRVLVVQNVLLTAREICETWRKRV